MSAIPNTRAISRARLWFGLFGGAIAWTAHFMASYAVAEFGCVGGIDARVYSGISLVAWIEIALSAVATLLAATATVVAYGSQRRPASLPSAAEDSIEVERYTARAGFLASSIFMFAILFESIAILFYLRSC